jgi:hypothetical protein
VKARCVNNISLEDYLTVGKVYDVIVDVDGDIYLKEDNGSVDCYNPELRFELIPDEPAAPKSDWMRMDEAGYVNMVTGMHIYFGVNEDVHTAFIGSVCIDNFKSYLRSDGKFADAFAALVGYDWPSAGKEM